MIKLFFVALCSAFITAALGETSKTLATGSTVHTALSETPKSLVAASTVYTSDYLSNAFPIFGILMRKISSVGHLEHERPFLRVDVELNNTKGIAVGGFVGFEYQKYNGKHSAIGPHKTHRINVIDVCQFDASSIRNRHLRNTHLEHSQLHFEPFHFDDGQKILRMEAQQHIKESGIWLNIVHLCVDRDASDAALEVTARQTIMNPLGYLGGEYLVALPVLALLCVTYAILSVVWLFWTLKYRRSLLPHIHWLVYFGINIVLAETIFHFYHYQKYNELGKPSSFMIIADGICSLVIALYARGVLVLISTGSGIAFAVTEKRKRKTLYFLLFFSLCYAFVYGQLKRGQVNMLINHTSASVWHGNRGWAVCVAFMDAILNWYVLEQLATVYSELEKNKQTHKVHVYQRLAFVMCAALVMSVLAITYHLHYHRHGLYTEPRYWSMFWMLRDGVWRIIFLFVAVSIIFIWRPHEHSLAYAYSHEIGQQKNKAKFISPDFDMENETVKPDFDVSGECHMNMESKTITPYHAFDDIMPTVGQDYLL